MGTRIRENYRNPCITMHQPWASLLVHGIKRIEGRSWPAPIRGRLWIHAAAKVPDPATIQAMEDFYREIYAMNGIAGLKFPEHYPVSHLLGCVDVVGCVKCEELVSWEELPEGVRLEGQTDFCWLCENPQKLLIPFEMRGYQGVYNLERKIFDAAVRGLCAVSGPLPVKFPLPDASDPYSLKPGSRASYLNGSKTPALKKPPSLDAAIAGARAAATQFKKEPSRSVPQNQNGVIRRRSNRNLNESGEANKNLVREEEFPVDHNRNLNQNQTGFIRRGSGYNICETSQPNKNISEDNFNESSQVDKNRHVEEEFLEEQSRNTNQNRAGCIKGASSYSPETSSRAKIRVTEMYPRLHPRQVRLTKEVPGVLRESSGLSTAGGKAQLGDLSYKAEDGKCPSYRVADERAFNQGVNRNPNEFPESSSYKIFAAAVKGLRPA
ncbi:uncharacterized protein LOC18434852 [Amborella trichopoda]|uniref:uncharacterized protein LOC18434852 n=1 Tax=Amborella trichopoda TaxID=13333 RepID=UPI0005D33ED4|nr:uncharacterized protein LOC18434852 [Amborella trichopoda]|eukprot:XP_011623633.1 uncharacterized protein LOC18434852 [Amborella trichopoda]